VYRNEYLGSPEELAAKIKAHWRQYSPQLYRELAASNGLESLALQRAQSTLELAANMEKKGLDAIQAGSEAMREIALAL